MLLCSWKVSYTFDKENKLRQNGHFCRLSIVVYRKESELMGKRHTPRNKLKKTTLRSNLKSHYPLYHCAYKLPRSDNTAFFKLTLQYHRKLSSHLIGSFSFFFLLLFINWRKCPVIEIFFPQIRHRIVIQRKRHYGSQCGLLFLKTK